MTDIVSCICHQARPPVSLVAGIRGWGGDIDCYVDEIVNRLVPTRDARIIRQREIPVAGRRLGFLEYILIGFGQRVEESIVHLTGIMRSAQMLMRPEELRADVKITTDTSSRPPRRV